jgi:hypothetical protein
LADVVGKRIRACLRGSAAPYLATLAVGTILGLWAGYLWPDQAVLKGQAPAVLVPITAFAATLVLWLILKRRRPVHGWALVFLILLALAWVINLATFRYHGDSFTYGALLFLPILIVIGLKPPAYGEGQTAFITQAWAITSVLVITRLLEMTGRIAVKFQPEGIIEFDSEYYWLPLNNLLGIDGRWPGPFGHNGYTAMMGSFIIVIAVAFWTRASWVFLAIGAVTLIVTSGRASAGAAAAGVVTVAMLTPRGWLGRVPRPWRILGGGGLLLVGLVVLFSGKSGLTGRQTIWPAFWELWQTSPLFGVGSSGIAVSGGVTQSFGHAHSMYLDLLARYGLIAFLVVMAALGIGLGITIGAGIRGFPGPLALLVAYLITAVTEPRNDWLHPGAYVLMVVVSVMAAAAYLSRPPVDSVQPETEQGLA